MFLRDPPKIGPPAPGGLQKNWEKMCKTFARHCTILVRSPHGMGMSRYSPNQK